MVDVRLISILPPPVISQPAAAQTVTTQGSVATPPQIPNGSILSGFILNRDATGNPILRTPTGDITFSTNFFLKIGSEVTIRIQTNAGLQSANILTVNGLPPEVAQTQSAFSRDSNVQYGANNAGTNNAATSGAPNSPPPAIGSNLSAVVVIPALPVRNSPTTINNTLPAGTNLVLSLLGINPSQSPSQNSALLAKLSGEPTPSPNALNTLLPSNEPTISAATASSLSALLATPAEEAVPSPAPTTIPSTTPTPNSQQPVQTFLQTPPQTAAAPVAASNQQAARTELPTALAQTTLATVSTIADDGAITIDSALGYLRVPNAAGLKLGDQLSLRVNSVGNANNYSIAVANAAPTPTLTPLSSLAKEWQSLQQLVQLLTASDEVSFFKNLPQLSLSPQANSTATQNLASPLLAFISALKGGDFRGWMGQDTVRKLEDKGYGTLLKKAAGEFQSIAKAFAEPLAGQWQSLFFPVAVATEVHQLRAFIKRDKKKDSENKPTGEEDTRFVLEMDLSQLGNLQMDGLVQRKPDSLRFDLIVRSHEPLPEHLVQDIEDIYYSTSEVTNYSGRISFQNMHDFPIHPLEETLLPTFDDVVV